MRDLNQSMPQCSNAACGTSSLSSRSLSDIFALRPEGQVSFGRFLAEASWLAQQLPDGDWLLNACADRYAFALTFVAGLMAGKTSLQPSSQSAETLTRISENYPGAFCVRDLAFDAAGLPCIDLPTPPVVLIDAIEFPTIADDRVVAILFTSGTTGLPHPQPKTWGRLIKNARAEAASLGLDVSPHTIIGTVPAQHSYGFESTFLLALQSRCAMWSGKPFFPQDIAATLANVPGPKILVTTPFHLSALLAADVALPNTAIVLSATAPLSGELAQVAEQGFAGAVFEIYGSSESGQLAFRRTVEGPAWTLLQNVQLSQQGENTYASGGHVEGRVLLSDLIQLQADGRFLLQGRHSDLINIAGKRTSLAYLNHQITAVPGVVDAAFFLPDAQSVEGINRMAVFVVAPGLDSRALTAALRERIDPIFLPRPVVLVDALPRNDTGKLPRSVMQALFDESVRRG